MITMLVLTKRKQRIKTVQVTFTSTPLIIYHPQGTAAAAVVVVVVVVVVIARTIPFIMNTRN